MSPLYAPRIIVVLCFVFKCAFGLGQDLTQYIEIDFPNKPYNLSCKEKDLDITGRTISWFKDKKRIYKSERFILEDNDQILKLVPIELRDEGLFLCQVFDSTLLIMTKEIYVKFYEPPKVSNTNLNSKVVEIDASTAPFKLYCNVTGIPKPSIQWFKDGNKLESTQTMSFKYGDVVLEFSELKLADEGSYKCVISNVVGTIVAETILRVNVDGSDSNRNIVIYSVSIPGGIGIVGAVGYLIKIAMKRCKESSSEISDEEEMKKLETLA